MLTEKKFKLICPYVPVCVNSVGLKLRLSVFRDVISGLSGFVDGNLLQHSHERTERRSWDGTRILDWKYQFAVGSCSLFAVFGFRVQSQI